MSVGPYIYVLLMTPKFRIKKGGLVMSKIKKQKYEFCSSIKVTTSIFKKKYNTNTIRFGDFRYS